MRKANKTAFRPTVEAIESRVAASSGLGAPAAVVHAAARPRTTRAPKDLAAPGHRAAPRPKPRPKPVADEAPAAPAIPPARPAAAPSTARSEAWVKLVNMTGQDLRYRISLGPYRDGEFLPFVISGRGSGSVQYRMASLIRDGQEVPASFAIRFDDGPVTPLNAGVAARAARGYYIFVDGEGQYYTSPIITS